MDEAEVELERLGDVVGLVGDAFSCATETSLPHPNGSILTIPTASISREVTCRSHFSGPFLGAAPLDRSC